MDLSISIVSWNTRDLLDNCLQSIFDTTEGIEFEVIVIDNASSDGTPEMVRDRYPQVRLAVNSGNLGFARANNQAYQMSLGRYFMLLNPDTVVHSGLQGVVYFLDARPGVGISGSKMLNSDGSIQITWNKHYPRFIYELLPQRLKDIMRTRCAERDADRTFQAAWVGGACLTARRKAIEKVGLLDELYYIYTEETDWCHRFRDAGWEVVQAPCVMLTHFGGQSTEQVKPLMRVELAKSKVRFMKKFGSAFEARMYVAVLELATSLRLLIMSAHPKATETPPHSSDEEVLYTELQTAYRRLLMETANNKTGAGV